MTVARADDAFAAIPDPGRAHTLDELIEGLRSLKVWAGDPSYEWITGRINQAWTAAGRPAGELTKKPTVVDCFKSGRRRLNTDLVIAVVHSLNPDVGYVTQWRQALRVVGGETRAASQVRVQDRLPPDLAGFTGRTAELDQLRHALRDGNGNGGAVICAIAGMAGVGKTQLAVHAGHLLARDKPFMRVLFVNLRGFHSDPAQPPVDPSAVLDGFLRLLGVPGQQIPHDLDARAAAYRSRLAGTHTLVVLDNAADAEQVRPLLPQTSGCAVLVTSRRSLNDLHPATYLMVDVFTPGEALQFFSRAVSQVSVGGDPDAAARIVARCGYLPLALGLVAGHIRGTPGWTLTDHAERLDERHRQWRLESGVELALNLSYQHLTVDRRRLLRQLALHPGQDFDVYAAAALADTDLDTAQTRLDHLCRDHLLQQGTADRYTFHDLVRAYASSRASDQDPPPHRRKALTRLFDLYLATAATAMDMTYPHERQHRPKITPTGTPTPDLADRSRAELWLDTELANLLAAALHAAQHGWPQHTWQLSATLDRHLNTRGRYRDAQTLHRHALNLAQDFRNHLAEMDASNSLGHIDWMLGRYEQAHDHHRRALQIAHDIGDRAGEQYALTGLGYVHWLLGRHGQAADHFERAWQIAHDIGDHASGLDALAGLGHVHWSLGRYEQASGHHRWALQIAQDIGHRAGEMGALASLGSVHRVLGHYEQAGDYYRQALQIAQDIGNYLGELRALSGLGLAHRMLGRHSEAAHCVQQIHDLAHKPGNSNYQLDALHSLTLVNHATGQPALALIHHEQALQSAIDLAPPADQIRAHDGLAHTPS